MTRRRPCRWLLGACIVLAGWVAMPASAVASFGLKSFEASFEQAPLVSEMPGPPDFQAGSHPYQLTISYGFNTSTNSEGEPVPEGSAKDIDIELPRGLVGDPNAVPQCSMAVFESSGFLNNNCPADTQIGTLRINTTALKETLPLSNLVPPPGVALQLGAVALVPLVIDATISSTGEYNLMVDQPDVSQALPLISSSVSLWGVPADPSHDPYRGRCLESSGGSNGSCPSDAPVVPFLTMPTSCGEPLTSTIEVDSWEHPGEMLKRSVQSDGPDGAPTGLSGCGGLEFNPTVAVQPESAAADAPTGLSVEVGMSFQNNPAGLAAADLRNITLALPAGLSINPAAAAGLVGCSPAQIGLGEASQPACPNASKIGAMEVESPLLLKPMQGAIYLAQSAAGPFDGVVSVYLAGEEGGLDLKLPAQLSAQSGDGRLTLTLNNAPELSIRHLKLDFFGGPRATIANPPACGTFTQIATLTPYSTPESSVQTRSGNFAIDEGCGGGFTPSFAAGGTSSAAGRETGFALQVSRTDGQQRLQGLTATLPPGLMANISSVPQCGDAEAAAGSCPAASEVGTVVVGAGTGPDPYYLNGRVYLTGPYEGAPFGISMVIPALAGPFELGTPVVRGAIAVNFSTSSMTITTDPFPTILRGIPLRIKDLDLAIDRPGFMVNPTDCGGQRINSTVRSTEGAEAAVSAPFGVVGCSGLPFAPKLAATTLAKASSRGSGASFDVKVTNAPGTRANLGSVTVQLPKPLRARLGAIQQACVAATFVANPGACPAASVVGKAVVETPMLGTPLTGPVYTVFHRGTKYPNLVMVLQGGGLSLQLTGLMSVSKGISSTAFNQLPDIPMSLFELDLPEGSHSLLGTSESLCAKPRSVRYTMAGQNGSRSQGAEKVAVEGCAVRTAKLSRRRRGKVSVTRSSARAGRRR